MATHFDSDFLAQLAQRERLSLKIQASGSTHRWPAWFVIHQGYLYIRSAQRDKAPWNKTLRANSRAILRVGRLHLPIRAVPVQDEQTRRRVDEHFVQKYAYRFPSSTRTMMDEVAETMFRLEPAEVEAST